MVVLDTYTENLKYFLENNGQPFMGPFVLTYTNPRHMSMQNISFYKSLLVFMLH